MGDPNGSGNNTSRLVAELRDRHVIQTAAIYVLVGLGLIEFVDIVFSAYGVAESRERFVIGLVLAGFPAALAAAWFLEWNRGRIRVRSSRSGLPGALVAVGAALVIAGPLVGGVALNLRGSAADPGAVMPPPDPTDSGDDLVIEIFEPVEWAADSPGVLMIEEGTSAMMHGTARYQEGINRVLLDGVDLRRLGVEGQQRMSVGLSDSARFASFTGFVDAEDEDGQVEIVVLGADGRYASRTFMVRKISSTPVTGSAGEVFDRRVAAATGRASDGRAGPGRRWAVIIGISDYMSDMIPDLQYADRDARALYDFLRSPAAGRGGIPSDQIRLLLNERATARNVRSALSTFLRTSAPEDEVLVFMAAHGMPDPLRPKDLYLLTYDTDVAEIATTALPMAMVREMIGEAYGYTKVVLADITHSAGVGSDSGPIPNAVNEALLTDVGTASGGFLAFTASESHQLSQEAARFGGGHGVFTYYLLEALRGGADENGDRIVSLNEMLEYTRDRVRRETRNAQVPMISNTSYDYHWPMAVVLDDG